jgi:hypothetical protein
VGEAERGQVAQKHVDLFDPDPDLQTLILTSRTGEEDTASWARLSRRLWETLSEVRRPKNMWIRMDPDPDTQHGFSPQEAGRRTLPAGLGCPAGCLRGLASSGGPKTCGSGGSGSGSATLILTLRSGEEETASWARLSRRMWERLSEVRQLKNM